MYQVSSSPSFHRLYAAKFVIAAVLTICHPSLSTNLNAKYSRHVYLATVCIEVAHWALILTLDLPRTEPFSIMHMVQMILYFFQLFSLQSSLTHEFARRFWHFANRMRSMQQLLFRHRICCHSVAFIWLTRQNALVWIVKAVWPRAIVFVYRSICYDAFAMRENNMIQLPTYAVTEVVSVTFGCS